MINGYPKFKEYTEFEIPDAVSVVVGTEVFNTIYQVKMRSNGTSWEWLGVGRSTWGNKPSIALLGQIICITDIGENGSLWRGNGTKWVRLHSIKFYDLSAAVVLTGTTSTTTLATITIPAGLIGANGKVKFYPLWSNTNNANTKTLRVLLNSWTIVYTAVSLISVHNSGLLILRNFNSETTQRMSSGMVAGLGSSTGSVAATTIDTTVPVTVSVTGQLANSADTMTLEGLFVEIS